MVVQSNSQVPVQDEARVAAFSNKRDEEEINKFEQEVAEKDNTNLLDLKIASIQQTIEPQKREQCETFILESGDETENIVFLDNIYFKSSIKNISSFLDDLKMENILHKLQCLSSELNQMYIQLDEYYFCNLSVLEYEKIILEKMKQIQSKMNEYNHEKKTSLEHKKRNLEELKKQAAKLEEEIKNEEFENNTKFSNEIVMLNSYLENGFENIKRHEQMRIKSKQKNNLRSLDAINIKYKNVISILEKLNVCAKRNLSQAKSTDVQLPIKQNTKTNMPNNKEYEIDLADSEKKDFEENEEN
ncbi:viral A-type inclusion protein [Reticulomyxa filosa]|uniref:Viral A-type inclusion protein n=1 Tax=Reticulomyxa filosa TaxID=46433 RepID=X6MQC4_RETFI|nr:viral A-type inclusion protein [Reticulomyxa filosa]|eukprot:ETO16203.1 viral A-type inclusion protein [Reticulomyxa filosa]